MKLKTSITIIVGCLFIFLFIMLPIFLSIEKKEDEYVSSFKGSSFSLKDINNEIITEESFNGPLTVLFFGFTYCPDVCPITLNKINLVMNKLDKKDLDKLKVFFISIDPERDTPEVLKDYLSSWENKFYGITGEPEKIFLLSRSWGILSEKIFSDDGTNYNVNHSSSVIILKNGKYADRITHNEDLNKTLKIFKKYLR
jgi:protein SCO1/2